MSSLSADLRDMRWRGIQGSDYPLVVNAATYGAQGNGANDDTAAIQNAILAAQEAGGGIVYLLGGVYLLSSSLVITADNVQLVGCGRSTQLLAKTGFPGAPMLWYQAPASSFRHGAVMRDLLLVNTVNAAATGIQLDSTYYASIERVDVEGVYAQNIYLNGTSGQIGAYTRIRGGHLGAVDGGATSGGFGVLTNNHEFNMIRDNVFNWFTTGRAVKLQNDNNVVDSCTFDECGTGVDIAFQPRNVITNCQFDRGLTRYIYMESATQSIIRGNVFGDRGSGATGTKMIEVTGSGQGGNIIEGNTAQNGTSWTYFYFESSGIGGTPPNLVQNNQTQGLGISLQTGIARSNQGFNPVGHGVAQPAVPASGTPLTNTTGADCTVYLTGGTFTAAHQIGGVSIGNSTATVLRVLAGQTITLTYSAAPTWQWFGD